MIVAVTGHRPNKLGGYRTPNRVYNSVMEGLDRALLRFRPDHVIVGMALGVDQWMAELCIFNGVPFVAAVPFEGFETGWPVYSQIKYRELLGKAASVQYISPGGYVPWKMQRRNEWMVDHCQLLFAVWDGTDGGTGNCVRYAQSVNRNIERIPFLRPAAPPIEVPRSVGAATRPPEIRPAREVLREVPVAVRAVAPVETEGQRAARVRALRELEREAEIEQRRRTQERQRIAQLITAPVDEPEPPRQRRRRVPPTAEVVAAPEPVKEEPVEPVVKKDLVREFGRFVDLDV